MFESSKYHTSDLIYRDIRQNIMESNLVQKDNNFFNLFFFVTKIQSLLLLSFKIFIDKNYFDIQNDQI